MKLLYFLSIIATLYGTWAQVLPKDSASIMCSQYFDFEAMSSKFWSQFDGINKPCSTAPISETPVASSLVSTSTSPIINVNKPSSTQSFVSNTLTDSLMMSSSPDTSTSTLPDSSSSATPTSFSTATIDPFPMAASMMEPGPGPGSETPSSSTKTPTWPMNTETNATPIPTGIKSSATSLEANSASDSDHASFVSAMWPLSAPEPCAAPEDDGSECKRAWSAYLVDVDDTMTTATPACWPMKNLAARNFWPECLST